ncbi:PREDICTED: stigma-specific [Prunus dulcis]|uniref:PREDICTED: stigma-specific n=1 Tax=Prunus dulcis TaxID=3755 RepID=A0A5E4F402_PRUDU|nr:stigma-specific STIG1-like protein 1 [Prunus dulcis]VVA22835.1 PREDICTED: stigma-specific [Prunus dulcis]
MKVIKILVIIATTMALSITLTTVTRVSHQEEEGKSPFTDSWKEQPSADDENKLILPSKRVSRFLSEKDLVARSLKAASQCKNDYDTCSNVLPGHRNFTCCNKKCVDLSSNKENCGACKKCCKYTESCCRGQCVDLSSDKRHCGRCDHPCKNGTYCVYGLCDYA